MRLVGRSVLIVMLAVTGVACRRHTSPVQYVPTSPPAPTFRAWLYLQVFDQRPLSRGGIDSTRAGWVPGKFGIPRRVRVAENSVARSVWTATADAMGQLGIGATAGQHRLVATVMEFWEDYVGGSGTHVVVRYQLFDPSGAERWSAIVTSGSGEPGHLAESPPPMAPAPGAGGAFTYALADLAAHARAQFATPAFQQAMAR